MSALTMSHGYAGQSRRSRKGVMIVQYFRKMLDYRKSERDSAWFGAGGGGQCTLWVGLVPCFSARRALAGCGSSLWGNLCAHSSSCWSRYVLVSPSGRHPWPCLVVWVCWNAEHTGNGTTGHRDPPWCPWPWVVLRKGASASPTEMVPEVCTNSTNTLSLPVNTSIMHIT